MRTSDFDFHLPNHLIATTPLRRRDQSRLLVIDRSSGRWSHQSFGSVGSFLSDGDSLVINTTKVFKARLFATRPSGGEVEILLVRRLDTRPEGKNRFASYWAGLVRPSRRVKANELLTIGSDCAVTAHADLGNGIWELSFPSKRVETAAIRSYGHVPLPSYMNRIDTPADLRRYQTVFADATQRGAVAAPTAGLHFTQTLLARLKASGIGTIPITLHVGPGTFKPIKAEQIEDHNVDPEFASVSMEAATLLQATRDRKSRIVAVGTTAVRTLESCLDASGKYAPLNRAVDLFIRPGHQFHAVDAMITNFHLPKSSLLVLVAAFAGRELILEAYAEAVRQQYRFYSYGDAMLIL